MTDTATIATAIAGVNLVATIGGGFFFAGIVKSRLDRVEKDVSETKTLVVSAAVEADRLRRAEADIENLENDMRDLRRGVGWIRDEGARGLDREYAAARK